MQEQPPLALHAQDWLTFRCLDGDVTDAFLVAVPVPIEFGEVLEAEDA